jgi:hypothetical protein
MQTEGVEVHRVDSDKAPSPWRIERKFYIVPRNTGFAYNLLRQFCRMDREYPSEQINSLYFDSPDLEQHERSLSGEFRKDKVRIRWYGEDGNLPDMVPVFLELKSREGFASTKRRQRLVVPAQDLAPGCLRRGIVPRTRLIDTLAGFGYFPESPLRPIIKISYWRYRLIEMQTGVGVALDGHIRSTAMAGGIGYGERELELPGGVIEVKGMKMELPINLRRMKIMDLDWSRFSKYSFCIDAHYEAPGVFGRLSPPGKIIQL